ncbi:hypothetical protein [Sphingomonas yantingensis]|uniref:hypothetical protein n=1 Tax=Sphingomonas yantingensis TaxID=1241761 RepID=UPI00160D9B4D|nr:hypothetical protein [Sphingomonas yantingensis]
MIDQHVAAGQPLLIRGEARGVVDEEDGRVAERGGDPRHQRLDRGEIAEVAGERAIRRRRPV